MSGSASKKLAKTGDRGPTLAPVANQAALGTNGDQRQEAATCGLWGDRIGQIYAMVVAAKVPLPVFRKRASSPLTAMWRMMAAYSVAAGVLPPGEVQ
jgi:hypothetical protein